MVEEKWKGDEENKSPTITPIKDLLNFDEVMVKGTSSHQKITISTTKLSSPELELFKQCLEDLQHISSKIITLIDLSDELTVPFSVYNSLKQLSDLNLLSEENHIILDFDQM